MTDTFTSVGQAAQAVLAKVRKARARPSFEAAKAAILAEPSKSNFQTAIDTGIARNIITQARDALRQEGKI
jgi:hypothetical protein